LTSLTTRTSALDRATRCAQQEIDLLREYRAQLITDVVTGRLDVREVTACLPDERGGPDEMLLADVILEESGEAGPGMDDLVEEVAE